MCEWILADGKNHPNDREVLLYIENDEEVYFGFCERQDNKTDWITQDDTYQWYFNLERDWHTIDESEVVCYLEYPFIPKDLLEKARNIQGR
jgi:hypothetical protein